jgi:hypothetical protein
MGDQFIASAIVENPCRLAAVNAKFAVSPLDGQGHGAERHAAGDSRQHADRHHGSRAPDKRSGERAGQAD